MNDLMQIQNMKIQIKNAEIQLDNLEMQMKSIGSLNIGIQINNMWIQLLNMGIQMINIGMNIPIEQNDMFNFNQNIQNIINQLQNIGMPNQQMGIPMGMNMPPIGMNDPIFHNNFIGEFDDGIMEQENQKLNVIFENTLGIKKNIVVEYGTTLDNLLKKYLNTFDRPQNIVSFLFNGSRIEYGDKRKIEDYFKAYLSGNPKIVVLIK